MKNILALIGFFLIFTNVFGQNRVDIRFSPTHLSETKSCFDLELRSIENNNIMLAGQNFRIFFNPDRVSFIPAQIVSYNPKGLYGDIRVLKKHHSDEISVTMINLGVDALKFEKSKVTNLLPHVWTSTSNVCFSHQKDIEYSLTWAREAKTSDLATAYVALSEWISDKKQRSIEVDEYYDYNHSSTSFAHFNVEVKAYPNPVVDKINLRIDNFGNFENGKLLIVDAAGNQIRTEQISRSNNIYQFDLATVPSGNYFIEITDESDKSIYQTTFVKSSL